MLTFSATLPSYVKKAKLVNNLSENEELSAFQIIFNEFPFFVRIQTIECFRNESRRRCRELAGTKLRLILRGSRSQYFADSRPRKTFHRLSKMHSRPKT